MTETDIRMPGRDKAVRIRRRLRTWYGKHQRRLPWRETTDPYRIWVSEVMLQQTQVATVIPYYRRFMAAFPDLPALARADRQQVLKLWEGLGYYSRARHLHRASGEVLHRFDGRVPEEHAAFIQLPGVGDYIAAAVLSMAFGRPHAVVDGNVKRVLARMCQVDVPVNTPAAHRVFKSIADTLLDRRHPGDFNQALMELGALVCRPRQPLCDRCPVAGDCRSCRGGTVDAYPVRVSRRRTPRHLITVAVVVKKNRVLILRRPETGLLGGLWEFPGGRIHKGEDEAAACIRETAEKTGLVVAEPRLVTRQVHTYTHFSIRMSVFLCRFVNGRVRRGHHSAHAWVTVSGLSAYPFHQANRKLIPMVAEEMAPSGSGKHDG